MQVRRIVTGHDEQGKSVFLADEPAPRAKSFQDMPGYGIAQLWATQPGGATGNDPTLLGGSLIPGPGGTSLLFVSLPPDSVMAAPIDPQRAVAEMIENLPGLIDIFRHRIRPCTARRRSTTVYCSKASCGSSSMMASSACCGPVTW